MNTVPTLNYDKKSCSNCSPFHRRMLILEMVVFTIIEDTAFGPETASDDETCAVSEVPFLRSVFHTDGT